METKNKKDCVMHRVDVFSLFNALYEKGETKLSDHFINEDDDEQ